jgi:hypothetical protein
MFYSSHALTAGAAELSLRALGGLDLCAGPGAGTVSDADLPWRLSARAAERF